MSIPADRMIHLSVSLLIIISLTQAGEGTMMSKPFKEKDVKEKEAIIQYLSHSGWAIKTQNHILIFDYVEHNEGSLSEVMVLSSILCKFT